MGNNIKKGLFAFIFTILLLPFVQQSFPFIKSGKLDGYFTNAQDVAFSPAKWADGTYQKEKGDFLNDQTGFRPDLIRLTSQLNFSLLNIPGYGGTVLGKDNCLYYGNYIDAFYGKDFKGYSFFLEKSVKMKALQDTFTKMGKTFVMVYSPCKAFYFNEYIPDDLKSAETGQTNYKTLLRIDDSLRINHVDLNAWFVSLKSKSREPLFTKQGIHWTHYGSFIAGDSLIRYIEYSRGIQMLHPEWTEIEHTTDARYTDNDIAATQNLIFPISTEQFSYPKVYYSPDTARKKPNVIFIGDSFVQTLITSKLMDNVFDDWQLWYYFRMLCNRNNNGGYGSNPKIEKYDWKSALGKTDCIVMMYTSVTLPEIGDGFIEQAYDYYYPGTQ